MAVRSHEIVRLALATLCAFALACAHARDAAPDWIVSAPEPGSIALARDGVAAAIIVSESDHEIARIAARDLAADIESVTGVAPPVRTSPGPDTEGAIIVGTVGRNAVIDRLIDEGRIDGAKLAGKWETFAIATIDHPAPGIGRALVIAGSDRRGTAFGVYELAQAIGVSPWHWWADVAPERKRELHVVAGTRVFGPPSVKYRGIFINDEDWGLQPWAATTFAPEEGGIGPKVYRRVFELLLRLKANTLWPAMHACTQPFNAFPENARLADEYGIVMGSSHAEPMLRNNVGEWSAPHSDYNYIANRDGVLGYWDERMRSNGEYENIYTLGMRGIHDSNMVGPRTDEERIQTLERIFRDQRGLIAEHVGPEVGEAPQMFCAYKEVLDLYRQGLDVPDDVTIVWPDDNFGYIRNFAQAGERDRAGGFGVYYHISYLGRPLAYLWLNTTPPALIWEEMRKAHDHGADRIWIVNVGDIKPAAIGTEFFLQMAWDISRWDRENLPDFLEQWAAREFGPEAAGPVASILADYHQLNFQRKPEHLQWWLPREDPRPSSLTARERSARLEAFERLVEAVGRVEPRIDREDADAFFQLVAYPVLGSALANRRYFLGEEAAIAAWSDADAARRMRDGAMEASAQLVELTRRYNEEIAGGKWNGVMSLEPADGQWSSMRIASWEPPQFSSGIEEGDVYRSVVIEAGSFSDSRPGRDGCAWQVIPGLGHSGGAITVFPMNAAGVGIEEARDAAPAVDYAFVLEEAGAHEIVAHLLPTHPLSGDTLRLAFALDGVAPELVELAVEDGKPAWAQGVLEAVRKVRMPIHVAQPGRHVLRVYGIDAGVVIDRIVVTKGNEDSKGVSEKRVNAGSGYSAGSSSR